MKRTRILTQLMIIAVLLLSACAESPAGAPTMAPTMAATEGLVPETGSTQPATEMVPTATSVSAATMAAESTATMPAAGAATATTGTVTTSEAIFFSTQFVPVEEQEKFRAILQEGGFDVTGSEEGPMLDIVLSKSGQIDVIGALHGSFPPLQSENALMNMIDIADDLSATRTLTPAYLETGLLGSDDFLYYVPWMQATYIMAANRDALEYLPDGADINMLTWEQFGEWCQNILEESGSPRCGLPHAGLFQRFLQGYLWPSFTGGMVTQFQSSEAAEMLTWARETLWPAIHPESINYEFMQEPLLAGDVWVAFDHTARLLEAFNTDPDQFVAFPAPVGPAGRGYMPVVVGLAIPADAPHPEAAEALVEYLTRPEVQARVLQELGFFPVVEGVDYSDLPAGIAIEAEAVQAQSSAEDSIAALLPVGLGARGGEINQIFRNAFDRAVINGEDVNTVLSEEGAVLQALLDETGAPCWAPDPTSDGPCQVVK